MGKHTPGPWEVRFARSDRPYQIVAPGADDKKAGVTRWGAISFPSSNEGRANARLIASAPDLLEALSSAALQIEYLHEKFRETGTGNAVLANIRAAISKATTP